MDAISPRLNMGICVLSISFRFRLTTVFSDTWNICSPTGKPTEGLKSSVFVTIVVAGAISKSANAWTSLCNLNNLSLNWSAVDNDEKNGN